MHLMENGVILHGGPIVFPVSAPRLVYQRLWYVLSCLWDGAYKRTLAANRNKVAHVAAAGFLSRYLNSPLPCLTPYNQAISRSSQCFTTGVTKAVVCVILSVGYKRTLAVNR